MPSHTTKLLPITSLLLDDQNPRLSENQTNQQKTALALANRQGVAQVIKLADDIVTQEGLDPLNLTAVVLEKGRRTKRYKVIEGNRRLLALRVLDSPALISPLVTNAQSNRLNKLADKFAANPIDSILCVIFDTEEVARHWITLRHTGQNGGVGLVEWGSEEKDRYEARHAGKRSAAGQIMEFVEKHGVLSQEARDSKRKIITTVQRVASNPFARERLGIDVTLGQVIALYPLEDLSKSLGRLVQELKTNVNVRSLDKASQRQAFVEGLPSDVLPDPARRLSEPVPLDQMTSQQTRSTKRPTKAQGAEAAPKEGTNSEQKSDSSADQTATPDSAAASGDKSKGDQKPQPAPAPVRRGVIPQTFELNLPNGRIADVYRELAKMWASTYLNASSVMLRVFLEMSIDEYIERKSVAVTSRSEGSNPTLAAKMKAITGQMHASGLMSTQLRKAIDKFADGQTRSVLGVPTFHLYVHNQHFYPTPRDLFAAWDQLEPFIKCLWPDSPDSDPVNTIPAPQGS